MRNDDIYNVGEQIQNIVQNAIDSKDFKELNKTVHNVVNEAMGSVRDGFSQAADAARSSRRTYRQDYRDNRAAGRDYKYKEVPENGNGPFNTAAGRTKGGEVYQRSFAGAAATRRTMPSPEVFALHPAGEVSGTVLFIVGLVLSVCMGIAWLAVSIGWLAMGLTLGTTIATSVMTVLFIACLIMMSSGIKTRHKIRRFRNYVRIIGSREYCEVSEIAEKTGKSTGYVSKQLEMMIHQRMFLQGRMDRQKTCLIVTDAMYQSYKEAQKSLEDRQKSQRQMEKEMPGLDKECNDILTEGRKFIEHIHACNDAIPGLEISRKISRLEVIVDRIFKQVEIDPSLAPELHKFMTYYLPTTQKLLDAYQEMDAQPVAGKNIIETKQEIEKTLDTINEAFENLLDSCYREKAWDISTDISVLQTMLANEGLTKDEMAKAAQNK